MKFIVDECIGHSVAEWLKQSNYDAISIYDDLPGMDDASVLEKAFFENRIPITSDKGFGEMIFKSKRHHCGVILLRLENEKLSNKIRVLKSLFTNYYEDLFGNFTVVTETTVRITKSSHS